ncbi:MAG: hypothetical protein GQ544_05870, partial [Candidatus Aminicenantes bacterium]|nr:hypothetical protein [Candidatus Aminicenantes bacterium]
MNKPVKRVCVLGTSLIILITCMTRKEASQPFEPVGHARISAVYDVEVAPPYAYALERRILHVLDIRDPKSVQEISSLEFDRARSRMALNFPYLYLYGFGQYLGIIDISKPERPIWVGEFPAITGILNDGFCQNKNNAYVVRIDSTRSPLPEGTVLFEILDLKTNPKRPQQVASIDLNLETQNLQFAYIAHSADHAYVLVHTRPQVKIIVIDTGNPKNPQIENTFTLPQTTLCGDIKVRKDLLFLLESRPQSRILIYRISDVEELELLGAHKLEAAFPVDMLFRDDVVYVSSSDGIFGQVHLSILNVKNPQEPRLIYSYKIRDIFAAGLGMALADDRLYLAGDAGPMPIFDVSQSDSPKFLGQWGFEGGRVDEVICGAEKMLVVNGGGNYTLFDIQDPSHLHRLARTQSKEWENALAVAFYGSKVILAYKKKPAQLLDLSQSKQPTIIARFETRNPATSAVMTQSHAFLGYRDKTRCGIEVIDLSDEQRPRTVAVLELKYPVQDIVMGAKRICATHLNGSLSIVDASYPEQLKILSRYEPDSSSVSGDERGLNDPRVAVSTTGDYVFLLYKYASEIENPWFGQDVLEVVDLRDASKPYRLSQLRIDRHDVVKSSMGLVGNFVILYSGDILVVDMEDPLQPIIRTHQPVPSWQFWGARMIKLAVDDKNLYLGHFEDGVWIYRLPSYL